MTAPVLRLSIHCRLRDLRGDRTLTHSSIVTGINRGTLSQLERGERLPRPAQVRDLELFYGSREGWYTVDVTGDEDA